LFINDVTGAEIKSTLRGLCEGEPCDYAFYYIFGWVGGGVNSFGDIYDQANTYEDGSTTTNGRLMVNVMGDGGDVNTYAGDYIALAYDGTTKNIYFPSMTEDTTLYVGDDGSTYNDANLCSVAYTAPTP